MSKTKAPSLNRPKQPSEEEIRLQAARAMAQQHHAMAQTFVANLCAATPYDIIREHDPEEVAHYANCLSSALMDSWYKTEKTEEESDGTEE